MIGETLEESDDICGAVVSRRKVADKISLWMRNANDEETIMKIGLDIFYLFIFVCFYLVVLMMLKDKFMEDKNERREWEKKRRGVHM